VGLETALGEVLAAFRGVSVAVSPTTDAYTLRATSDPNDIQTPTVYVPLPDVEFMFNKGRLDVAWAAYLVPPNAPKQRTTTEHLSAMVDSVAGLYPFTTGELYSLTLPGGTSAQAYKLTWHSHIPIGE